MVAKALEVFGDNVFIAYDIGCSFSATVRNSSLGPIVRTKGLRFGTPAWHGWSHNRQCQLDYHPLFTIGLGLEDAEGCERVFSRTNGCARAIRYSSKYHRKQAIDLTVSQWNVEKHHNLGEFIVVTAVHHLFSFDKACSYTTTTSRHSRFCDTMSAVWPDWRS